MGYVFYELYPGRPRMANHQSLKTFFKVRRKTAVSFPKKHQLETWDIQHLCCSPRAVRHRDKDPRKLEQVLHNFRGLLLQASSTRVKRSEDCFVNFFFRCGKQYHILAFVRQPITVCTHMG